MSDKILNMSDKLCGDSTDEFLRCQPPAAADLKKTYFNPKETK